MDDLARFCRLNSQCPDHDFRGGENLSVHSHSGKGDIIRFLRVAKPVKLGVSEPESLRA
jgi:hypothetical protein